MNEEPRQSPEEEEEQRSGPLRTFLGLFLVPLLVVLACVAVFIGFGWIAYERHGIRDYVNDLESGWKPRRAQAAYELSKILVADPEALDDEPGARERVRELFQSAEADEMRHYLALVLGHVRDRESVPDLIATLDDPNSETRIYALWALGAIGDPRGRLPVEEALSDPDAGLRKTAAYALGEMGLPESIPALRARLEDTTADVRWNAALALARLGSDAGVPVLEEMLDRGAAAQVPGITPEQLEDAMIEAVGALAASAGEGARPLLERLGQDDPSLKVRKTARDALAELDG